MLKPMNTYILVTPKPEILENGTIFIPDGMNQGAANLLTSGIVDAINSECTEISIGDTILYNRFAITKTDCGILVREEDVYAVLTNY